MIVTALYLYKIGSFKNSDTDLTYRNSAFCMIKLSIDLKNERLNLGHFNVLKFPVFHSGRH